ncbi:hypothetical protein BD410DRAFT_275208 [Rickenella mellea]|uniref:Uncharacterized protein n=1 Tax=Rickenella mellea TaxID=50990 RepID=A0A4Y7Q2T8_9AGAM|nr:hypothetical protein BD410DRAFT_275208 [Rickenella mellea]
MPHSAFCHLPLACKSSTKHRFIEISSLTSQSAHPRRLSKTMAVSQSPSRDPRRLPSAVASSSRRDVRRILGPVSNLYQTSLRGGASRSSSPTRESTIESTEFPTTAPATEREVDDEVNNSDTNNALDVGGLPADATDESPHRENAIEVSTEYAIPETRNNTNEATDNAAATIKDAPPTSPIAVGNAEARHASPSPTPHEAPFKLALHWFIARSDEGSTTSTTVSVPRTDGSGQNIAEVTDTSRTDVPTSSPDTNGVTTSIAAGSSPHTTDLSQNIDQPHSATGKGKNRTVDELAEEGESDDKREDLVAKCARMNEDATEEERKEKREGKKRARSDDDDASPISSGDNTIPTDDDHQSKRAKRSMEGSSVSHGSSPRHRGTTIAYHVNNAFPAPGESQENETSESVPAAILAPPTAPVIATLNFHSLVTPDVSVASSDDESDSTYSYSGSSSSSDSDDTDTDTGSGDESDNTPTVPPVPAAAPAPIPAPLPALPHGLQPPFHRRMRAFYGAEMAEEVISSPYV